MIEARNNDLDHDGDGDENAVSMTSPSAKSIDTLPGPMVIRPNEYQQQIINLVVRAASFISLIAATHLIYTVMKSKYYRKRIFHKMMMCCSCHIVLFNILLIWGQAAVPIQEQLQDSSSSSLGSYYPGAHGTIATCTIQGFLLHLLFLAVPYYYVSLPILCLIAFARGNKYNKKRQRPPPPKLTNSQPHSSRHNGYNSHHQYRHYQQQQRQQQQQERSRWISKLRLSLFIHVCVYLIPIATGMYLLSLNAFNPSLNICFSGSYPLGCGDQSQQQQQTLKCERGPQNFDAISQLLGTIQVGTMFLLPAIIMFIYCIKVRLLLFSRRDSRSARLASLVAKQAALYVLALYWTCLPTFINWIIMFRVRKGQYVFVSHLIAVTFGALQGVWFYIPYWYFRSDDRVEMIADAAVGGTATPTTLEEGKEVDIDAAGTRKKTKVEDITASTGRSSSCSSFKPEFSIFDGGSTDALDPTSPWSKYLYGDEGEDDSYQDNCEHDDSTGFHLQNNVDHDNDDNMEKSNS